MRKFILIAIVVIAIVAAATAASYLVGQKKGGETAAKEALPSQPYHSVFLTNGQVYFGKFKSQSGSKTTLVDIYYLQVQQPIQPPPEGQQQQPQISLVKLGNELHKPKDEMMINNEHVLFTEEIQEGGQVMEAIRRFQRGEVAPTPSPSPSPETKKEEKKQQ